MYSQEIENEIQKRLKQLENSIEEYITTALNEELI